MTFTLNELVDVDVAVAVVVDDDDAAALLPVVVLALTPNNCEKDT